MNQVPRWRIVAAVVVLMGLIAVTARVAPIYFRNLELQSFVSDVAQRVENRAQPDDMLRSLVLDRAHSLDLPVKEDDVHIIHSPEAMRIEVRYLVHVELPGYTVNLHFYPGAGSR